MSLLDVFRLGALVAAAEQQDHRGAVLRVVHAVAGAVVDPQFAYASANVFPVSRQAIAQALDARGDAQAGDGVAQSRQPFGDGLVSIFGAVGVDGHAQCSLKATNAETDANPRGLRMDNAQVRHAAHRNGTTAPPTRNALR